MVEQQKRDEKAELWRRYIANIVPMWGDKGTKRFEDVLERYERRLQPVTRDEVERAEEIGREVAARFGM
jgi:hypothetical protein